MQHSVIFIVFFGEMCDFVYLLGLCWRLSLKQQSEIAVATFDYDDLCVSNIYCVEF